MSYHFCTIASSDYLPFVKALQTSLQRYSDDACLHVLLLGESSLPAKTPSIRFYRLEEMVNEYKAVDIVQKYQHEFDNLRWALKPVFISFLLKNKESLIYLDGDIFFFAPYQFLFEQLEHHSFLLTPHWSPSVPLPYTEDFELNYKLGLFNAGFIGVSRKGMQTLKWWTELCFFKMSKDFSGGYFVDQRYLDMLPVIDEQAGIVRHLGCNVAGWNIHQNIRSVKNGVVVINDSFPIVFVHFNRSTLDQIKHGNDPLLQPYLQQYKAAFEQAGYSFAELMPEYSKQPGNLVRLKRMIRLRTRIKHFLLRLYQKL